MGWAKEIAGTNLIYILDTLNQYEGDSFSGIVESDETFFEDSEKGNRHLSRPGRKRGTAVLFHQQRQK